MVDSHGSLPMTLVVRGSSRTVPVGWYLVYMEKKKVYRNVDCGFFGDYYKLDINQQISECSNVSDICAFLSGESL